ncbi:hypothetical protein GGS21DRAFT_257894 [Xylaria nigripes]|nr:hypothetical protein GGS21DRAFT_257894 [Xylaria nigripes]
MLSFASPPAPSPVSLAPITPYAPANRLVLRDDPSTRSSFFLSLLSFSSFFLFFLSLLSFSSFFLFFLSLLFSSFLFFSFRFLFKSLHTAKISMKKEKVLLEGVQRQTIQSTQPLLGVMPDA